MYTQKMKHHLVEEGQLKTHKAFAKTNPYPSSDIPTVISGNHMIILTVKPYRNTVQE